MSQKIIFECGIVGESHDQLGDEFLLGMMRPDRRIPMLIPSDFPAQFTYEQFEMDWDREEIARFREGLLEAGYVTIEYRENISFSYKMTAFKPGLRFLP